MAAPDLLGPLKRDFQKLIDCGVLAARIGKAGLRIVWRVFEEWHLFRGGGFDRDSLMDRLDESL